MAALGYGAFYGFDGFFGVVFFEKVVGRALGKNGLSRFGVKREADSNGVPSSPAGGG